MLLVLVLTVQPIQAGTGAHAGGPVFVWLPCTKLQHAAGQRGHLSLTWCLQWHRARGGGLAVLQAAVGRPGQPC